MFVILVIALILMGLSIAGRRQMAVIDSLSRVEPRDTDTFTCNYGDLSFQANSLAEAKAIMDSHDRFEALHESEQAWAQVEHGHNFKNPLQRCDCGLSCFDYRSAGPYGSKPDRCPLSIKKLKQPGPDRVAELARLTKILQGKGKKTGETDAK